MQSTKEFHSPVEKSEVCTTNSEKNQKNLIEDAEKADGSRIAEENSSAERSQQESENESQIEERVNKEGPDRESNLSSDKRTRIINLGRKQEDQNGAISMKENDEPQFDSNITPVLN